MKEPSKEVKEVERRYEETIDKMQQLIGRLKTERMSQAEFEQYAKEHGYIISTTNIIEQIRDEIQALPRELPTDTRNMVRRTRVLDIIGKYMEGKE
jgi:transposase-like protein